MKNSMPGWPQTISICVFGAFFCFAGYRLSRIHGPWGAAGWTMAGLLILAGLGFVFTVFLFYLKPQYGSRAFPALFGLLLGHFILAAILLRVGMTG